MITPYFCVQNETSLHETIRFVFSLLRALERTHIRGPTFKGYVKSKSHVVNGLMDVTGPGIPVVKK